MNNLPHSVPEMQREQHQRKERSISLQKDSKSQSHPNELSENCKKGGWDRRAKKEGQLEKFEGNYSPTSKAPPREKGRSKRDVERKAMEKNRSIGVIEKKNVRGVKPIECFLSIGVRNTYVSDGKSALAWELPFPGHLSST